MFIAKPCSAEDNEKPWIIVTDLNTPQMHVLEFLTAVKAHDTRLAGDIQTRRGFACAVFMMDKSDFIDTWLRLIIIYKCILHHFFLTSQLD